jgi:uncharacterized repeat protein (TIGR03803 family)
MESLIERPIESIRESDKGGGMSKLNPYKTIILVGAFFALATVDSPAQTFKTVFSFDGTNGANPSYESLVQGFDGNLYGTAIHGGTYGYGTVFKITPGGALTTLHSFDGTDGAYPFEGLVLATNGDLYGTTSAGGANGDGTIFVITPAGKLTVLHSFDGRDGCTPYAGLVQASSGNFYGTTTGYAGCGDGTVFEITPTGKLTTLFDFDDADGRGPSYPLVQAPSGSLYGTTYFGGFYGYGTVFEITLGDKLTTLHNFDEPDGAGANGLIQAANGNFYGTTFYGGANDNCSDSFGPGCGTVFEITPVGKLTTLYSFCSRAGCADGAGPTAGVLQATNGDFYGTTTSGGAYNASGCTWYGDIGCGTVFKITSSAKLTTLHSFCSRSGCPDGNDPVAGLFQGTNGILYGTTTYGGAGGDGTIFSLSVGLGPFAQTIPTSGKIGAAVAILGNNLTDSTRVTFNGKAATFKVVSSTEIRTTVPSGGTTGYVKVKTPSRTLTSNVKFRIP